MGEDIREGAEYSWLTFGQVQFFSEGGVNMRRLKYIINEEDEDDYFEVR